MPLKSIQNLFLCRKYLTLRLKCFKIDKNTGIFILYSFEDTDDTNRQEKINFSDKESIYEKIQNHEN